MHHRNRIRAAGAALAILLACGAGPAAAEPPRAAPASVGVSQAGLDALNREFHGLVDQKKLAGVVTLLARKGKVVHFDAYGAADAATGAPARTDTIWRIASMTKPVTGVAMMILWEEGRWKLDDPVHKHIPEFRDLKVRTPDGRLVPQDHPMTMAELMSHTAGFDVSAGYAQAGLSDGDLQGMIDKLAKLPLAAQPGADWRYGPSVNIQGYLVEKLSGQSLDQFFQTRIFTPLRMADTQFWVAPEKLGRLARVHTYDAQARIVAADAGMRTATAPPKFLAGSGGLYSTAEDYWRFAQMLLNGGELDGARILRPETVKLMRTNVLRPGVKVDLYGPSQEGVGFGMDFAIIMDPKAAATPQGKDTYYWGGAFGTWFWIDPTNDLVFVGMIQNLDGSRPDAGTPPTRAISYPLVYQAVTGR
ncbi:serine hydrolase domain-containing protein [Phenylobacterium sp.]|uniref:serine hydrolase domain-containing protein n=1 Tax=Phenylobacterium sp. TaxID=1871053 RepID=UPI0035B11366